MGCDHKLYLMLASTYHSLLRPKLIKYYGPLARYAIKHQEKQLLDSERLQEAMLNFAKPGRDPMMDIMNLQTKTVVGPMEKYFKRHPIPREQTDELYEEISELLAKQGQEIYDNRNYFLRQENMIEAIDRFEDLGVRIRVSNKYQVENYILYMETCIKAMEEEKGEWKNLYDGADEALEGFKDAYAEMTADKDKQMYLIFESVN